MEKESKCFSCGIKLEETLTAIQCSDCIAKRETTAVQHKATSMRGGPTPLNLEAIQRNSGGTKSSISKQEAGKGTASNNSLGQQSLPAALWICNICRQAGHKPYDRICLALDEDIYGFEEWLAPRLNGHMPFSVLKMGFNTIAELLIDDMTKRRLITWPRDTRNNSMPVVEMANAELERILRQIVYYDIGAARRDARDKRF